MHPDVINTPYATSSKEQTGNIITFAQFEEGKLLSETRDDVESDDESDDNVIILPLISEEEIDAMNSGDESEDEPMSMEMLEYMCGGIQYHPIVNRREARVKICDLIKIKQLYCKGEINYTQNMGNGLQKLFKTVEK